MRRRTFGKLGFIVPLVCGSLQAEGATKEIRFQWNGSGCEKSESTTPWDPMVVQVVAARDFGDEFQVKRGGGASPKDSRKVCDLIVSAPESMQFALDRIDIKGSGAFPQEAKIDWSVDVSSQGNPQRKSYALAHSEGKALETNFVLKKAIDDKDLAWSNCGRSLLISTKQVIKSGATVSSKLESVHFNVQAKACKS